MVLRIEAGDRVTPLSARVRAPEDVPCALVQFGEGRAAGEERAAHVTCRLGLKEVGARGRGFDDLG
jgi:hypothetical protein